MEGQIALWMWVAAAAFFITGVLIGMAYGRSDTTSAQRVQELEAQLHQHREELAKYREQVAHHFMQTADLLHTLTANYRAVYEHLADGAQTLCAGQVRSLTPAALRERLLSNNHQDQDAAEADPHAAAHQVADAASPQAPAPAQAEADPAQPHGQKRDT
jgi:uncharacterized membrane-anchored protein YhcB (DUF1043 family)